MTARSLPYEGVSAPLIWVGRRTIATAAYLGGVGLLALSAVRSLRGEGFASSRLWKETTDELQWMFAMGLPLVGLIHVGLGSFLALQAYYGGTFVEGTGAVVGVGLIRNVAPLMACQVLAILIAARVTPDLRSRFGRVEAVTTPKVGILSRPGPEASPPASARPPVRAGEASEAVAARLAAGAVAGSVMGLWGSAVGTLVGWSLAKSMMGVSTHTFFRMFWEMLWARDIVGLFAKGSAFGLVATLLASHEGIRGRARAELPEVAADACRAACLATAAILVLNAAWFILFYHAGPAFGPTLLKPPTR